MSEYYDIYGPDGTLIFRRPKSMMAQGAPPSELGKADRRPVRTTSMSQTAATLSGAVPGGIENFGPGTPYTPNNPHGTAPRQYQYPVAYNIAQQPRSSERVGFAILRELARMYDVAAICIRTRINQIRGLDWDIVPAESGRKVSAQYRDEIAEVKRFFTRPDRDHLFDEWLAMIARDWLEIDATTIYRRRFKYEKERTIPIFSLEPVDGTTIKPLLDLQGRVPDYPYVAFQQFLYGVPQQEFTKRELIYRPYWVKTDSPYGEAPLENLLLHVNTDVRMQWNFVNYFTEGNIPEGFGETPETWSPTQVQEWQDIWDALLAGDPSWKRKIKFVPHGFNFTQMRAPEFDPAFPMHLLKKTCAAFSMTPAEIGFTDDVNRSTGESQQNTEQRKGLLPAVRWIERLLTSIIHEDFDMPFLKFKFLGTEPQEDELKKAQANEIRVRNAVMSPDQWAEEEGREIDPNNPIPRVFIVPGTPIPAHMITQRAMDQLLQPTTGEPAQPGDEANTEEEKEPEEGDTGSRESGQNPLAGDAKKAADDTPAESVPVRVETRTEQHEDCYSLDLQLGALTADLRKWRDNTIKRFKDGQKPKRFESEAIPGALGQATYQRLQLCKNAEEAREVFQHVSDSLTGRLQKQDAGMPPSNPIARLIAELRLWATYTQHFGNVRAGIARQVVAAVESQVTKRGGKIRKDAGDPIDDLDLDWEALIGPTAGALQPLHAEAETSAVQRLRVEIQTYLRDARAERYAATRAAELVGRRPVLETVEFARPDGSTEKVKVPKRDEAGMFVTKPAKNAEYDITETTRDMLRRQVTKAKEEGWTPGQLQAALENDYAFSPSRALTIARTEAAWADNSGTIAGYDEGGVKYVEVVDGDQFDEACKTANGQRWTLEEARRRPLEHPGCTRMFLPVVE